MVLSKKSPTLSLVPLSRGSHFLTVVFLILKVAAPRPNNILVSLFLDISNLDYLVSFLL